ncbi:DUF2231 domain-containing protein [Arthrobacter sp. ISL-28]|uniref:DUF2231 domain-containing protein n=1 Tax=Arthrobacter sp. ISL-28 TaxID=2819108 RepID=UPI001BE57E75|nr:DUF2231 domain-containing protein [Arthrobacter sp. ISL-28]MBT2520314.1 hypothetical protein [Arthrobacter sp. ISL-28]
MDYVVSGLPLHVLLVHGTVVIVPMAAVCTVLSIVWPEARRRLGIVTPLLALAALVMVPITQQAGEWLLQRVDTTPAITTHSNLGATLLPWVIGVFLVAMAQWLWFRYGATQADGIRRKLGTAGSRIAGAVAVVLVLVLCGGTVYKVVEIGEAGSRAVWEGSFSNDAQD